MLRKFKHTRPAWIAECKGPDSIVLCPGGNKKSKGKYQKEGNSKWHKKKGCKKTRVKENVKK